jgi:hypothetical protein
MQNTVFGYPISMQLLVPKPHLRSPEFALQQRRASRFKFQTDQRYGFFRCQRQVRTEVQSLWSLSPSCTRVRRGSVVVLVRHRSSPVSFPHHCGISFTSSTTIPPTTALLHYSSQSSIRLYFVVLVLIDVRPSSLFVTSSQLTMMTRMPRELTVFPPREDLLLYLISSHRQMMRRFRRVQGVSHIRDVSESHPLRC